MQISKAAAELLFFPLVGVPRDHMSWIIFSSLVDLSLRGKVKNKTWQGVQEKGWVCFEVFSPVWQPKMQVWGSGWRAILIPTPEKSSCESSFPWEDIFLSGQAEAGWGLCSPAGDGFFGNQWWEGRQTSIKEATSHCPDIAALHTKRMCSGTSSTIEVMTQQGAHSLSAISQEKTESEKSREEVAYPGGREADWQH